VWGPFIGCSNRSCKYKENLNDQQIEDLLPASAKTCENGHKMVVRRSWKGVKKGVPFLGCSNYPECRHTRPLSKKEQKRTY
jgi:ssDNA-binding Zn-finger/Zn-ribbon topoisomerase 1